MFDLKRSSPTLLGLTLVVATTACHEPFSNEDLEFLKALPTREQVAIDVPGTVTSTAGLRALQALGAARAKHYDDTKRTSDQLNAVSAFVLSIVEEVQSYPPTARDGDTRLWGPFPGDPGTELMMSMSRVATSTIVRATSTSTAAEVDEVFEYGLAGRSTGGEWRTLFAGRYAPGAVLAEGMGVIFVDFEAVRALGDTDAQGLFYIAYDNRFGQQTIEMTIDLAIDPSAPFEDVEAGYRYRAESTGEKAFVFAYEQNIPDFVPDTGPETFIVAARFLADQRGRADVAVQGGDLGAGVYFEVECWDEAFLRTFLTSNVPGSVPEGAFDACAPELRGPFED